MFPIGRFGNHRKKQMAINTPAVQRVLLLFGRKGRLIMARRMNLNVSVKTEIHETEPDGSNCLECGDMIFLKAFHVVVSVNGRTAARSRRKMCQGCGEEMRRIMKGPQNVF